eukprot:gene8345-biopygen1590
MWCGTFALESDFNSELMECGDRETAVTRGNKGMATQSSTYGFICSGARLLAILHVGRATSGEGILQRQGALSAHRWRSQTATFFSAPHQARTLERWSRGFGKRGQGATLDPPGGFHEESHVFGTPGAPSKWRMPF